MLKIVSRSYNAARMRFISRWISAHTYNRSCFLYFPISAFHIRVRHFLHKTPIFKKSRIVAKYLVIWNSESRKCQDAKYFFYVFFIAIHLQHDHILSPEECISILKIRWVNVDRWVRVIGPRIRSGAFVFYAEHDTATHSMRIHGLYIYIQVVSGSR